MVDRRAHLGRTSWPALIAVLAALGIGAGAAIAGAATTAPAAGGLSVTPAVIPSVPHAAVVGRADSVVLANTTTTALKITVTPRPWVQSSGGHVSPNPKVSLAQLVSVSRPSFTLAAGASQSVTLTLRQKAPGGSLYAAVEAIGVPVDAAKHKGVSVGYRLITALRLDPATAARKLKLTVSAPQVQGSAVVLPVRNAGNTIDPVNGTVKLVSSLGTRNVTIAAERIVPGASVSMVVAPVKTLVVGRYVATYTLMQNGRKVVTASHAFTIA
jgi:hypothetical protein